MSNPKSVVNNLKLSKRKKGDDHVAKPEKAMKLVRHIADDEDHSFDDEELIINNEENHEKYKENYMEHGYACRNQGKEQHYAKDSEENEIYFKDENENESYAFKTILVNDKEQCTEFPAKLKDNTPKYIYKDGIPIYPENLDTGTLIFPIDPKTNEEIYLANENGQIMYPKNKRGKEYYRRDANNKEIPLVGYAKDENGNEIYPKLSNDDEYYLIDKIEKREFGARRYAENGNLVEYYARKQNGDEFYPRQWIN